MPGITLEEIIRRNTPVPASPTKLGWYPVLHQVCDHGRKGPRAAFKFEGDVVGFHCFNCNHIAKYEPAKSAYLSDNMKQVMEDFLIPQSEYQQAVIESLKNFHGKSGDEVQEIKENLEPDEIPLLPIFYPLYEATDSWGELARYYLEDRGVDPNSYPFMLAKQSDTPWLKKWFGRVIIPIFKGKKVIFYTGRDLTGKKQKKYETPSISRDTVLYGYDRLFTDYDKPLYVVEGWFDANAIDGVAIFGNEISDTKVKILNRTRRKKVYIPDRYGSGRIGGESALEAGWAISTPNIGTCKDMDEAVQKYGKLYVLKTLAENTVEDNFEAIVKLRTFCEK